MKRARSGACGPQEAARRGDQPKAYSPREKSGNGCPLTLMATGGYRGQPSKGGRGRPVVG